MSKLIAIVGFLTVFSFVAHGDEFYWTRGGDWGNYADGASWTVDGTGANPDGLFPGKDDWIRTDSSANFYFDLGDGEHIVKGFSNIDSSNVRNLGIRNGTLTFTSSFTNYYIRPNLYAGGKLIHAATASSRLGMSGAKSRFTVQSGAELEMYGAVYINNSDFTVQSGGKAIFDFDIFAFDAQAENMSINDSQDNQGIFNSGETSFPNGLRMLPRSDSSGVPPDFRIRQIDGTMTLGGDMVWERPQNTSYGRCDFHLDGGSLNIITDVKIQGFNVAEMTEGATVSVTIAEGMTFDASEMKFADATTLNVSGGGVLILGDSAPAAMNLESSKMTIRLTDHIEFNEVTGYENTDFEIAVEGRRGVQVSSGDRNLLSHIYESVGDIPGLQRVKSDYCVAYFSEQSDIYCIAESVQHDFDSPTTWKVKTSDGYGTPVDYPGYNDFLHPLIGSYSSHLSFNLNGRKYKVRGMNYDYAHAWPLLRLDLRNGNGGSLEFVESFTNRNIQALGVYENSRLIIGHNCKAAFAWQGALNNYIIKDGGAFDCFGELMVGSWRVTNEVNGVVNFAPKSFTLNGWGWHLVPCWFDNQGQWDFPNGLTIDSVCGASNQLGPWSFNQRNGMMRFGGPLVNNNAEHRFDFNLYGGTLKVDADLEMGFCTSVGMPEENTAASIDVAEGKTLNWTNATFAAGTRLYKKGAGILRLGADVPEVVVSNGTLRVEGAATVEKLSLSSGATFVFAAEGAVNLGDVEMEEGSMFSIDESLMLRRYVRVLAKSSDAETLEAVCARMVVPEKYAVQVAGDELRIVNKLGLKVIVR